MHAAMAMPVKKVPIHINVSKVCAISTSAVSQWSCWLAHGDVDMGYAYSC